MTLRRLSWNRKPLLMGALAALIPAGLLQAAMIRIPGDPRHTASGEVAGTRLASGVGAYLGIPYARPPVQSLRWMPPQPLHWSGVWNADHTGPECIQVLRPHDINHYFGEEATGEDCLYLNVWVPPGATPRARLPVVVFIHGGGGTVGSAGMAVYDGEQVARRGAVFVSFNYRLGILGFMAHPELTREQGGHSGNYGYLDQNAALAWIHANIGAFGGDPDEVVITGQSFGALSVAAQLFSPLSRGLFRAAAMWSACNFTQKPVPRAIAEATGVEIQQRLHAADLAALRAVPADQLLALQEEHQVGANVKGLRTPPTVDGLFWTTDQPTALAAHAFNDVPLILGSTGEDIDVLRSPFGHAATVAQFEAAAHAAFGADAGEFLRRFPVQQDADVPRIAHEAAREIGFLRDAEVCARLQAQQGPAAAYIDVFTRRHPYVDDVIIADQDPRTVGAYHTGDVPYWFQTHDAFNRLRPTRVWTQEDRTLSDLMMGSLIAFARTGSPASAALPWPGWSADDPRLMIFDTPPRVEPLPAARMEWLSTHTPLGEAPPAKPATRD